LLVLILPEVAISPDQLTSLGDELAVQEFTFFEDHEIVAGLSETTVPGETNKLTMGLDVSHRAAPP
jgi:hypothetical protein